MKSESLLGTRQFIAWPHYFAELAEKSCQELATLDVYLEESVCVAQGVAGLGFHSSVPQLLHSTRTAALDRVWGSFP
jgi:hypothetical protein